jgi:hypothetical protein
MRTTCKFPDCDGRTVPVLDAELRDAPHGGNPYRVRCLRCDRFLPSTSKDEFKNHDDPRVLPRGADRDDPDEMIPLLEWDRREEFRRLVDRLDRGGGDDVDDGEGEPGDGMVDDVVGGVETNRFRCPACDGECTGYPDECPSCGAIFEWT